MHQLTFSELDPNAHTGTYPSSTPLIGTPEYDQQQWQIHFEEQNELGQYLSGPVLKRAGWDISFDGLGQKDPNHAPWHLHHEIFTTAPQQHAEIAVELAAYITIKFWLTASLEDERDIQKSYPHLLSGRLDRTRKFFYSCGGVFMPTVEEYSENLKRPNT